MKQLKLLNLDFCKLGDIGIKDLLQNISKLTNISIININCIISNSIVNEIDKTTIELIKSYKSENLKINFNAI